MQRTDHKNRMFTIIILLMVMVVGTLSARAAQVQDVVRLKGSEGGKLVGMGLVVGLAGTGDGGKFLPAMRPLATVVQQLIDPNTVAAELNNAKNVALVALTANIPETGVREGDRLDVQLAAIGPSKSLVGGRLFVIPMTGPLPGSPVFAFAEGPVSIEDAATPTVGVVKRGAQLTRDVMTRYLDQQGRITLVLNDNVAGWPMANNLANLINGLLAPDGPNIAQALDQKNVAIAVPEFERTDPAAFISQILTSYVDPSLIGTGAKVVVNERTGTIVVTGDVQISPVIISHKGLTITTLNPPPVPTVLNPVREAHNFIAMDTEKRASNRLADLLTALNQLKVEAPDRIAILKELHRSGKLHAQLILE